MMARRSVERDREQIDRLAMFILEEVEGEPSQSEGAVDTAIRIIRDLTAELASMRAPNVYGAELGA